MDLYIAACCCIVLLSRFWANAGGRATCRSWRCPSRVVYSSLGWTATDIWHWTSFWGDSPYAAIGASSSYTWPLAWWTCWWHYRLVWWSQGPVAKRGMVGPTSPCRLASSSMPLLQHVNYVLITNDDFHAFARNPHGLMELGFREAQLCTTVFLPYWPAHFTDFLAPLWAGMQTGITVRAFLNGIALTHQLVPCESGFFLRVTLEGNPYVVSQIEHMASSHTL